MEKEALFKEGERLFQLGKLEGAKECFLALYRSDPEDLEITNNLGVVLFLTGDHRGARALFEKVLAQDPNHPDATANLAELQKYTPTEEETHPPSPGVEIPASGLISSLPKEEPPATEQNIYKHADCFFILSAGLSGLNTAAQIFNTAENCRCYTYKISDVGKEALAVLQGRGDGRSYLRRELYPPIAATAAEGQVFGAVSAALTAFVPLMAEDLPRAKFVIILRHPLHYVHAALRRDYCLGIDDDDKLRLPPREESAEFAIWKRASQVEKICRMWNAFQEVLQQVINGLPPERVRMVRFEDLFAKPKEWEGLFQYLGLKGFSASRVATCLSANKTDGSRRGSFPRVSDWSDSFRTLIVNTCRSWGEAYGYLEPPTSVKKKEKPARALSTSPVPRVTVGLPLYSGGTNLAEAIESILAQDCGDFQLLVLDCGTDPFVQEIGRHYEKRDRRVRFINTAEHLDYIGAHNFARLVDISATPYFMWASWDDRVAPPFIARCLAVLEKDETVALVYPRSYCFDKKGDLLGYGADTIKADVNDPGERYLNVIRELKQCNAFYGLFRRDMLAKTRALRMTAYAHDNLLLAEVALLGKIIQVEEVLFYRRLTRDYGTDLDAHHARVIRALDPLYLEEGLTLPFCRLTYAHCEILAQSDLTTGEKERLTRETVACFRQRWGENMRYEIDRLIRSVKDGVFFLPWDGRRGDFDETHSPALTAFHRSRLLKVIQEAMFIYPKRGDLREVHD
ncbi:MAG: tetratricopeptide repeat protein, partial [Syntrophales bacterium]|nr:tetratricopeptide repeat protein [Syntrophales bacterium]